MHLKNACTTMYFLGLGLYVGLYHALSLEGLCLIFICLLNSIQSNRDPLVRIDLISLSIKMLQFIAYAKNYRISFFIVAIVLARSYCLYNNGVIMHVLYFYY